MSWRMDAEGRPPQTRPTEAEALALQAELMDAPGGPKYCVVWWQGPGDPWKAPQAVRNAPLAAARPKNDYQYLRTFGTAQRAENEGSP